MEGGEGTGGGEAKEEGGGKEGGEPVRNVDIYIVDENDGAIDKNVTKATTEQVRQSEERGDEIPRTSMATKITRSYFRTRHTPSPTTSNILMPSFQPLLAILFAHLRSSLTCRIMPTPGGASSVGTWTLARGAAARFATRGGRGRLKRWRRGRGSRAKSLRC